MSSSIGPAPGSISQPAANSSVRRPTIGAAVEPMPSSTTGRRSLSAQARKPQELERVVKGTKSTPLKKPEATPVKRVLERTASVPTRASAQPLSGQKTKSKPEALVAPTPVGGGRRLSSRVGEAAMSQLSSVSYSSSVSRLRHACDQLRLRVSPPDVSSVLKPKRLASVSSLDG